LNNCVKTISLKCFEPPQLDYKRNLESNMVNKKSFNI
jgi:hypothetical protein